MQIARSMLLFWTIRSLTVNAKLFSCPYSNEQKGVITVKINAVDYCHVNFEDFEEGIQSHLSQSVLVVPDTPLIEIIDLNITSSERRLGNLRQLNWQFQFVGSYKCRVCLVDFDISDGRALQSQSLAEPQVKENVETELSQDLTKQAKTHFATGSCDELYIIFELYPDEEGG